MEGNVFVDFKLQNIAFTEKHITSGIKRTKTGRLTESFIRRLKIPLNIPLIAARTSFYMAMEFEYF